MTTPFGKPDYVVAFAAGRRIPKGAALVYGALLNQSLGAHGRRIRVLDIGCGTGRFFFALASAMPGTRFDYTGVDTSALMIAAISQAERPSNVETFQALHGGVECADTPVDLIIMSEMIHLINDLGEFFTRCAALLAPGGIVAIRTTRLSDLAVRDWYRWFPAALSIDMARHKSQELIDHHLSQAGLSEVVVHRVDESVTLDKRAYIDLHASRPYSTLHLVDHACITKGLARMEEEIADGPVARSMMMTWTIAKIP